MTSTQLTDIIHLLLCRMPHEGDMLQIKFRQSNCCYYYLESDIAKGVHLPDHVVWSSITSKLKTSLSLGSDREAMDFIRQAIKLSQELRTLVNGNEDRLTFIKGLLL